MQKTIYLAGGCFWGTEEYFSRLYGVTDTECGYANGITENPSYEQVCRGDTGHAEAVRVRYDAEKATLPALLSEFFKTVDPTSLNRQGGDLGTQYRTGIYYTDDADLPDIRAAVEREQKKHARPVVTEVLPLQCFYEAEEYHQDYLKKNPNGYCHVDLGLLPPDGRA